MEVSIKKVSREQFYAWVNPRDICVRCVKTGDISESDWTTRSGLIVGKTVTIHDYTLDTEYRHEYYLKEDILSGVLHIPKVEE
jgi:hypothetical protein